MKTLEDVKQDMSDLYESVKSGETDYKIASELTNIAGKFLKADSLELARDIFIGNRGRLRADESTPIRTVEFKSLGHVEG